MRRAALVFNPACARAEEGLDTIRAGLAAHFDVTVVETSRERDADACAKVALASKPDLVIAAGGDGTVSMVAGALVGTDVPLGIIARGTSNSIAAGLDIPTDLAGAIGVIVTGAPHRIDTARANGRSMLLHAAIGLHAAAVGHAPREAKSRWGVLAYLAEGLIEIGDLEPFAVEIETERETVRCRATNVMVANVAPLKTLFAQGPSVVDSDDGELDVTIVAAASLADVVVTGLHLFRTSSRGEAVTRENVGYLSAKRVRIVTDPPQPLLVDGEPAGDGPLDVSCVPSSLIVIGAEIRHSPPDEAPEKLAGLPDLEVAPKIR